MAVAAIAAAAALASAATGIYGAATADRTGPARQSAIAQANLEDARNNSAYMRLLNTIGLQRAAAGSVDAEGSTTYYDPATNQWISTLGKRPQAVQTAGELASISRNTTDLRNAQHANELAIERANAASPGADAARRELENYRPSTAGDVTSLLLRNIVDTTNRTQEPFVQSVLRNAARTGSAADTTLAAYGRDNADSVRKSIIEATIQGRNNVGAFNSATLGPLQQKYAALQGGASPNLQYSQIDSMDPNKVMQTLLQDRIKTGATAAFGGMQGLGYGQYAQNTAAGDLIKSQVADPRGAQLLSIGNQISDLLKNPTLFGTPDQNKKGVINNWFGSGSSTSSTTPDTSWMDKYTSKSGSVDPW